MARRAQPKGDPDGWLPNGLPVYGQVGVLEVDCESGTVQCAACGRWFNTVSGAHLTARHGLTVARYREMYGLGLRTVLEAPSRRAQRRASALERMRQEPQLRAMLEAGAADARSGELIRRAGQTSRQAIRESTRRPERVRQLRERGRRGNQVIQEAFRERLRTRSVELGFTDLTSYLMDRHGAGISVSRISAELGCARQPVVAVLDELSLPGRLDPAHPVEAAALARVGYPTLAAFLLAHPPGTSPKQLADALGHSVPWLTYRARRDGLADRLTIPPTAEQRAGAAAQQAGFPDLPSYLRFLAEIEHCTGGQISRRTGLTAARITTLLDRAGVTRRSNEEQRERQTLDKVGWTGTLTDYVVNRDIAGWSIQRMSQELGRSDVWLARRLRSYGSGDLIRPPGHRQDRPSPTTGR